jgi:hypothetical protein
MIKIYKISLSWQKNQVERTQNIVSFFISADPYIKFDIALKLNI